MKSSVPRLCTTPSCLGAYGQFGKCSQTCGHCIVNFYLIMKDLQIKLYLKNRWKIEIGPEVSSLLPSTKLHNCLQTYNIPVA